MGWDKTDKVHRCNKCGVVLWMDIRQERFRGKNGEGATGGDPYVCVNYNAFFEPGKKNLDAFMYCFDCEPIVTAALKAINTFDLERAAKEEKK